MNATEKSEKAASDICVWYGGASVSFGAPLVLGRLGAKIVECSLSAAVAWAAPTGAWEARSAHRATHGLLQPVVQRPTEPIKRGQAERKHNRFGCLVGGEQWLASREDRIERARAAEAKKTDKGARFWERNRPDVRAAESALALSNGDPLKLSVKLLKAIVVSRTGSCAKSKNNKIGELLSEALTALSARPNQVTTPTTMPCAPYASCQSRTSSQTRMA